MFSQCIKIWHKLTDHPDYSSPPLLSVEELSPYTAKPITLWFFLIALSAKLAQVDGPVSMQEKSAVPDLFPLADKEPSSILALLSAACADKVESVAYSCRILHLFPSQTLLYKDVIHRLLQLALCDGPLHIKEEQWLQKHRALFNLEPEWFHALLRRSLIPATQDPYTILGLSPRTSLSEVKKAYHNAICKLHPDRLSALSVSPLYASLAAEKCTLLTSAYTHVRKQIK